MDRIENVGLEILLEILDASLTRRKHMKRFPNKSTILLWTVAKNRDTQFATKNIQSNSIRVRVGVYVLQRMNS